MVIKKKGDKNWEYCVYIGKDENGKKKYKRKCGFKTKKACIEEAATYKKVTLNKTISFNDACSLFLEHCKNKGLRQTTIISYSKAIKTILKNFEEKNKNIKTIKTNEIYKFLNNHTKLYSNGYKRKIIEIFKYVFSYAKKNKMINNNIFDDIPFPKFVPTIKNIWSESDIRKYLPILKNFKYFDIVYLALETGLRRGEIVGLTWDCINFERDTLTVNKSFISVNGFSGFSEPKTQSGIREIVLLNESIKLLKKRYKNRTSKYVFPNPRNNNIPANPHTVSSHFKRFLINHNIKPIRFHDLRHIHATLLLNKDINYKILSKRLGHSNISFTLQTYTHVIPDYELKLFKNLPNLF